MEREDNIDEQPGRERIKILLIEDNPGDTRLIRELLHDYERSDKHNPIFDIIWADSFSKGLDYLNSQNIDALLLDLSLPDSSGFETVFKAIDRAPDIPIIILTGLDDETLAIKALQEGAQDYLLKGQVDSYTLGRAILYAIERKRIQTREKAIPVQILLVEDHDGDAKLIYMSLTEFPPFIFDLTHVRNLSEAFDILDRRSFDIILLDLMLPDSHGIETFVSIHERASKIPIIVITVLGDERHATQALRKGAQDYIVKGQIVGDLLIRRIQYAIERHRLERERQLSNAEEIYRSLASNSQSGIYIIQDGKMQFVNPYIVRSFGFSEKDLKSMSTLSIIHPEDREMRRANAARMKRGESATPYEYRIIDNKGGVRWMMESVSSISFRGKQATLGNVIDITERKLAEMALLQKHEELHAAHADLKQAQARLIQQEKMASIGQLAAGITHEINNPMSFITGNLGILQTYIEGITETIKAQEKIINNHAPTEARETLKNLRKKKKVDHILNDFGHLIDQAMEGAERVRNIVANLKTFSRMEEDLYMIENIHTGIESTINIVWNEIKYKAELVKEFGEIPLTCCNISHLNQVFMNLLVNAAQSIEKWGKITVKTWAEGDDIYVSVADTGSGIPEEILDKIFDPFFTTKASGKGTGLGLSISSDIVKRHNGDITVESRVGEGTTFTVRIPILRS